MESTTAAATATQEDPMTTTITDIHTTARARFFGRVETRPVIVEPDGDVLAWDDVAGHYTRCHGLSRATQQRIAAAARRGDEA